MPVLHASIPHFSRWLATDWHPQTHHGRHAAYAAKPWVMGPWTCVCVEILLEVCPSQLQHIRNTLGPMHWNDMDQDAVTTN